MRFNLLLISIFLFSSTIAQKASISEELQTITTYPFSDPNPLPAMAINKKVSPFYPYFMYDGYTDKGVSKKWKVVTLQNQYITVTVLPEVGGKVMGAIERSTGKEFVYLNHVMKFRAIGIRGPWTSGGIEHNFGLDLGHAPWAGGPVDYILQQNEDGSVSCVVGGLDLASRSEWRVKIHLQKDKAYFTTESMWFNPLPLHQAYLSWENAAFKASEDLQFYFPGNYHIGHDGQASPWPIDDKGRDLSLYRNNKFGDSKSYHVVGDYRNWFGGYWHDSSFGFGHWSPYSDAPGKKLWIWSLARSGAIWEDLLTDKDGQYIEAQSGVKLNQAAERSGYHSPFRQLSHRPLYSETKSDYWFPVKETNGMVDANPYGTLNVALVNDQLSISVNTLQVLNDSLVVTINNKRIYSGLLSMKPMEVFKKTIRTESDSNISVNIGNRKLYYSSLKESIVTRPVKSGDTLADTHSAERLFLLGEEQNAMRNFDQALELYQQCVSKEPTHSEALSRIAELYYREGKYKEGVEYARRVLAFSAYDGSANYIYGALQLKLGKLDEAEEALSIASRIMEYRSAAYSMISGIELLRKNYEEAALYAEKSIGFNKYNLTALQYRAIAFRKLKNEKAASNVLDELLQIDPLDHMARFERYLLHPDASGIDSFRSLIRNEFPNETYLELCIQYSALGLNDEAIKILEHAPENPINFYWLAWLTKDNDYLKKATDGSPYLVFPSRLETVPVLEWAAEKENSWKAAYYLALAAWNNNDLPKAKQLFRQCGEQPDYAPFYLARGILLSDEKNEQGAVLNDFKKALTLDAKEWRSWHAINEYYENEGLLKEQLDNAKKSYDAFPKNPVISIDYAKALLNNKNPQQSIRVLNNTLILPQEGAREGHEILELAYLVSATDKIEKLKYKDAINDLIASKEWPERLGSGKPYSPDTRLQDYLLAFCFNKLNNPGEVKKSWQSVMDFSNDQELFNATHHPANNYISALVLKQAGKESMVDRLFENWKNSQDSLVRWSISRPGLSPEMEWTLSNYKNPEAGKMEAQSKMSASGKENYFRIFLRALNATRQ